MIKRHLRTSIIFLAFLVTLFGALGIEGQNDHAAALSLSLSHVRIHGSSLSFDWRISNNSNEPVYVYATFLRGPAALVPTNQAGLVRLRTSLSTPEPAGVNAYPSAKFLRIESGGVLSGRFTERKLDRTILKGVNAVEMEVAFGPEMDELKRQISMTSFNGEHPGNPIVAWQTEVFGRTAVGR